MKPKPRFELDQWIFQHYRDRVFIMPLGMYDVWRVIGPERNGGDPVLAFVGARNDIITVWDDDDRDINKVLDNIAPEHVPTVHALVALNLKSFL